MLYLVRPYGPMSWLDLPGKLVDLVIEQGKDLDQLDAWKPADRQADQTTVALALRHGTATATGIALEAHYVSVQHRPAELAELMQKSAALREKLKPQDAVTERLIPGWTEHGREVDQRVEEAMQGSISEAQEELDRALDGAEPKQELRDHWQAIGGHLPR